MESRKYIKPEISIIEGILKEVVLGEGSYGFDGQHDPITEQGDDDIIIDAKKNNLWDDWED